MPIKLKFRKDGNQLDAQFSGKLTRADYEAFGTECDRLAETIEHMLVLFKMDNFHGWRVGATWEGTSFAANHLPAVERIAVIGERFWQQGMTTFCKPFTKAEVRFFDESKAEEAQRWLSSVAA